MTTRIKNLLIIPEHTSLTSEYINLYRPFTKQYKIKIFSWDNLKKSSDNSFLTTINCIFNWIDQQQLNFSETLVILKGCSSLALYNKILQYNPFAILLVSVPFVKSMIDPFLSDVPSYKIFPDKYCLQLQKEYYNFQKIFTNTTSAKFLEFHTNYQKYFAFYNNFSGQLNDYLNLKNYLHFPIKDEKKIWFFLGKHDKLIDYKKQLKILNQLNLNYQIFENSAHQIEFDEPKHYLKTLQNLLSNYFS